KELAGKNLELARSIFGDQNLLVANALFQLGEAHYFSDNHEKAEPYIPGALRIRMRILGHAHLEVARSLLRLGDILHKLEKTSESEAAFREGLAICGSLHGEKTLVEADLLAALAVRVRGERPEEAEES